MKGEQPEPPRRQEVLDLALELAANDEARRLRELEAAELAVAASEVGLEPRYLQEAEAELERRAKVAAVLAAEQRARRRSGWLWGAAFAGAAALLVGVAVALAPAQPPPEGSLPPWTFGFDDPAGWTLDKNPATDGSVAWTTVDGRGGVARLEVTRFGATDGQKHRMNLDGAVLPADVWGYRTLWMSARGTLPVVRVYLESGQEERWRSPPIHVTSDWSTHRFDLTAFTHQRRVDGKWRDEPSSLVPAADTVSVKVGDYMNDLDDAGWVEIDDLELR